MHYLEDTSEWGLVDDLCVNGKICDILINQFERMSLYSSNAVRRPNSLEAVQEALILASQTLKEEHAL